MGRAGGRGGGGGRSGGSFGGSRGGSFGGSRGGSFGGGGSSRSSRSNSGRSYSSGSRTTSSGGWSRSYWGPTRTTGPIIINNSGNRNYNSSGNGGSYPNRTPSNNKNTQNSSTGCLHIALILIMVFSLVILLFNTIVMLGGDTENRTKLDADVNLTTYYTDELDWINNSATLTEGMKYFYEKTGVQPYLYITDNVGGSFYDYAEEFANNKYDELFTDEAHLLLIFHEKNDWYDTYCLAGSAADTVIDSEARMILLDTLDEYYYDSSLDDNEYFSKSFKDAADEIMKQHKTSTAVIVIPLIVFIAALAAEMYILKKAKEEKRAKELKEMLEKPLETFGSTEAAELAKKYETKNNSAESAKVDADSASAQTTADDKCLKCGSTLEENSNFCSSCGVKIEK